MLSLREAMDRLLGDAFITPRFAFEAGGERIAMDMQDSPEALIFRASLPGAKPEDVSVEVSNGQLTVKADAKQEREEKQEGYVLREIRRGALRRTLPLPSDVDTSKAECKLDNGILTLTLPKAKSAQPARIQVKS